MEVVIYVCVVAVGLCSFISNMVVLFGYNKNKRTNKNLVWVFFFFYILNFLKIFSLYHNP